MQPIYTDEPFAQVAINIIGPLPRTDRGNCYILTVVNLFTKHLEAYALVDQEATTVACVFLNKFVSQYEVLYVLHTDQGATLNQPCLRTFVKCLISRKQDLPRTTHNVTDKWSA